MSTELPVVDPADMPMIVYGEDDWRSRYDALREKYPAFRVGADPTVWFTRYEAVREIVTNGDLFWAGAFGDHGEDFRGEVDRASDRESAEEGVRHHVAIRQACMDIFAPNRVAQWEGVMQAVASDLIGRFADAGQCDFVHDFAHLYFPLIGCDMIGVPREDWDQLVEWERDCFKVPAGDSRVLNLDNPAMRNIIAYVHKLLDQKRANPDDRLATWVAKQQDDGVFTAADARWAMELLVLGSGHTVAAHLGYVLRYLSDHPELQARLVAEPGSVNGVCEELLRLYALGASGRVVTADVVFHGVELKKGDRVHYDFSMVNRDPRGPDFDRVDFDRKVNKHLAFNQGWKQCMGLFFARRARNIAVTEWHKRIPRYELDRSKPLVEQVYAGVGFHQLPLKWDVA